MTGKLFWILVGLGAAVLIAVYWAANEESSARERKLRRIRKRLEEIERKKSESGDETER